MRPSCLVNVKDDDVVKKKKKWGEAVSCIFDLPWKSKIKCFGNLICSLWFTGFSPPIGKERPFFFFSFFPLLFTLILLLLLCYQTNIRYPRQADSLDTLTLPISYRVFLLGTASFLLLGYCLFPFYLLTNVNRFRGALRTSLVFFFPPDLPK